MERSFVHIWREQLITTLKEQVSDLSLYLEEERLNHKDTKRKVIIIFKMTEIMPLLCSQALTKLVPYTVRSMVWIWAILSYMGSVWVCGVSNVLVNNINS